MAKTREEMKGIKTQSTKAGYFFDLTDCDIPPVKTIQNLSESVENKNSKKFDVNEAGIFLNVYNGKVRFNLENTNNSN